MESEKEIFSESKVIIKGKRINISLFKNKELKLQKKRRKFALFDGNIYNLSIFLSSTTLPMIKKLLLSTMILTSIGTYTFADFS